MGLHSSATKIQRSFLCSRIPLHYAFVKTEGNLDSFAIDPVEVVTLLLEAMKGKEINASDSFGCSPLHYAAFRGATVSCLLLIQVTIALTQ